jgi:PAS domain S-box-containing protein
MNERDRANILMVDDQAGKLLSYEAILSELGENLIKARSAREAMEQLLRNDVAVVLMDVSMPEINGFELADMMHRHPRFQKTAIIFISAVHLSDLDRIKGYQSGAVDYLSVPIVPELLRAKVGVFIDLHRKTRQLEQLNRELEQRVEERTEQLRQSEEQFRTLANSIPQLAWMADAQGSIFWYNQRWYDYIGAGKDEIERWGWPGLQHPDHVGRTMERLKQAWSAGEFWEDTFPLLGKDEKFKWFIARAVPLRDSQGSVARWFGTCTDISDQIAAEEKIRHLNSQLQQRLAELESIMQVLPVGVAVSQDPACDVITGNAALNEMLGAKLGDNISLNGNEPNSPQYRIYRDGREVAFSELPLQRSVATNQPIGSIEMEIRHIDGSIKHLLASANPIHDQRGGVRGAVGAFFDVTGRKQMEDLLRERADLLELATEAILVRDLNGLLLFWNSGAEALYGWKREEVLGKPIHEVLQTHFPDSNVKIESVLAKEGSWEGNLTQTTRDGKELVVASRLALKARGDAILEINRDITAQLQAEEALRKAERLAAMGRVAGIIAHEINNPLEAISNTFFLLRDHPSLDEEARRYAQMGEQEMLRLSHITRQTLGFYRESKHPVEVSIPQLLDDILELQLRRLEFNKVAVEKRYNSRGTVQGFPVELKQVFLNLIGNAVQAMPDGGKLRLHVFQYFRRADRQAGTCVCICDTGVGIDAEHARHLFEPFFTTKAAKGTGLGLWISKGIIQKYGGTISFRSIRRSGTNITCFRIFLPYADLGVADRIDTGAELLKVAEPAGRTNGRG